MAHHLVGMAEIAEMLGISRQRVSQIVESYADFPAPEVDLAGGRVWSRTAVETWIATHPERRSGRPAAEAASAKPRKRFFGRRDGDLFAKFTERARQAVVKAQEEARLLRHNYIGTEHLLLGLLSISGSVAWQALQTLDVTLEWARDAVRETIGEGTETPEGHIPFTPRTKNVLECSASEALRLGHDYVGTEHVLLALVAEREGVGWKVLEAKGLDPAEVRHAVLAMLVRRIGGHRDKEPQRDASSLGVHCSFCGKTRDEVAKLIAGSGVFICDDCVRVSVEILEGMGIEHHRLGTDDHPLDDEIEDLRRRVAALEERFQG